MHIVDKLSYNNVIQKRFYIRAPSSSGNSSVILKRAYDITLDCDNDIKANTLNVENVYNLKSK